jgi:hypothetical protein
MSEAQTPLYKDRVFQYFIMAMILCVVAYLWLNHFNREKAAVGQTIVAKVAVAVEDTPKEEINPKSVKAYKGGAAFKGGLKLPQAIVADESERVLASSETEAFDDHPKRITTVLNETTGEVETYETKLALPWIAWDDHGQLGAYGGIKNGEPTIRIEAQQGIFSVKAVHFGAVATVDQAYNPPAGETGTDYYVGVGAWYRW